GRPGLLACRSPAGALSRSSACWSRICCRSLSPVLLLWDELWPATIKPFGTPRGPETGWFRSGGVSIAQATSTPRDLGDQFRDRADASDRWRTARGARPVAALGVRAALGRGEGGRSWGATPAEAANAKAGSPGSRPTARARSRRPR